MRSIIHQCFILILLLWQVSAMGQVSTAAITGQDDEVCQGDSVSAYLHMTGNGPWTLVINDEQGEYLILKEISSPFLFWLKPEEDNNY